MNGILVSSDAEKAFETMALAFSEKQMGSSLVQNANHGYATAGIILTFLLSALSISSTSRSLLGFSTSTDCRCVHTAETHGSSQ